MLEEIRTYIDEIEIILKEIDSYKSFKKLLLKDIKDLNKSYENGNFSYEKYVMLKQKLLGGKTKKDQVEYFNAYILSLVRKLEYLNTQIFSIVYKENPDKNHAKRARQKAALAKKVLIRKKEALPKAAGQEETVSAGKPVLQAQEAPLELAEQAQEAPLELAEQAQEAPQQNLAPPKRAVMAKPVDLGQKMEEQAQMLPVKEKSAKTPAHDIPSSFQALGEPASGYESGVPRPHQKKRRSLPHPRRKGLWKMLKAFFSEKKQKSIFAKQDEGLGFRGILNFQFIRNLISRIREKDVYTGEKTSIERSILDFHDAVKPVDFEGEAKKNPNLLIKQATQLKEILKKRHLKIYSPSIIGTIANISVRRLSVYLIDSFPDFFKKFYLQLRLANIKLLSNTYVNIMVFLSLFSAFLFGLTASIMSFVQNDPWFLIISKAFLMAAIGAAILAGIMIYYPSTNIKKRRRSINTNLPFAIDHMSSLVASGVSPATMFGLLAQSKEYGVVSLEIEKISNFIDVFGYDLITAAKSVAATTPSAQLKEFFDGLISTIETGGSLKNYLSQRSKESMLAYRLERQKYVESISTYSDIYTGVLIAAPLFFVSALSLVSMLGGKIGGFEVDTVIAFGTYLIIPALNVLFIIFLEFNQPEV